MAKTGLYQYPIWINQWVSLGFYSYQRQVMWIKMIV